MTQPSESPEQQTAPTQEQLDAVNARLDQLDASNKRARARERAMHSTPHREPPPVFVNRTLAPEMAAGGIPDEARADKEVAPMLAATTAIAKDLQGDLAWLQDAAAHFQEMAGNLMTPGETSQRLLAATFAAQHDKFIDKITRVTSRLDQLDAEAARLEKQEKQHAMNARHSLHTTMAPHVASEVRQWLRSMPSDSDRASALRAAIHAGDRELLHAVTEVGVPPQMLGFRDRKTFDSIVDSAERKFGPEHVHRREAAKTLRARVKAMRDHLHNSSETTCALAMLEKHPALKQIVERARLK